MMSVKENILKLTTGLTLVVLLVFLQFSAIIAMEKCGEMCEMHDHHKKDVQSCCHSVGVKASLKSNQVCSFSTNSIMDYPAVKTQLKRLSSFNALYSSASYQTESQKYPPQKIYFIGYSSGFLNYKDTAIYLLDSISLS